MNMKIRAKMLCQSVSRSAAGTEQDGTKRYQETVRLTAVTYGDNDENKTYAQYTPNASVDMTIDNQRALGAFEPGEEYYVDFTPANR